MGAIPHAGGDGAIAISRASWRQRSGWPLRLLAGLAAVLARFLPSFLRFERVSGTPAVVLLTGAPILGWVESGERESEGVILASQSLPQIFLTRR
jgi:hypothetical protein